MCSTSATFRQLAIIGDVHGKIEEYAELTKMCDDRGRKSIQVGDMGFSDHYKMVSKYRIDPERHKFFPGNHDDYEALIVLAITAGMSLEQNKKI